MSSLRRDLVERKLWMVVAILVVALGGPRVPAQGRVRQHHSDGARASAAAATTAQTTSSTTTGSAEPVKVVLARIAATRSRAECTS